MSSQQETNQCHEEGLAGQNTSRSSESENLLDQNEIPKSIERRFRREACIREENRATFNVAKVILKAEILTTKPWPNSASVDDLINKAWKSAQDYLRRFRESLDGVDEGAYSEDPSFLREIDSITANVVG